MGDDNSGPAHASQTTALQHADIEVLHEPERPDFQARDGLEARDLLRQPLVVGAGLDLQDRVALAAEYQQEAGGENFLQERAEAGDGPGGDEAPAREGGHGGGGGGGGAGGDTRLPGTNLLVPGDEDLREILERIPGRLRDAV